MKIYNYKEDTKEYLNSIEAYEDPEASRRQGKFIPMMPANSTLLAPSDYDPQNQIPVFEDGQWVIKADYRKNYKKVTDDFITEYIKDIGEIADGCVVTKELAEEIDKNPDRFKIENGEVIRKSDEEYAAFETEREKERIANLNLTAADVERAIYKAKGIDFDDVIRLVEAQPLSEDDKPAIDLKALKIELKANNFYRGNPYIDAVGTLLGFTKEQLDEFFETNDYTKLM